MIKKSIKFNTGRNYTPEGQVILAWVVEGTTDQYGSFTVRFIDHTRMITGQMDFMLQFDQDAVMRAYDKGLYDDVCISDEEFNQAARIAK